MSQTTTKSSLARPDRPSASSSRTDESVQTPTSDESNGRLPEVLEAMRQGDRNAAAAFITQYSSRIRRRIRGKLGPSMRRLYDSQEILSTLGRRLDRYVRDGRLKAAGEPQLWSLIFRMADNALIDKARVFRRLQAVEGSDGPFAHELLQRFIEAERKPSHGVEVEIDKALRSLSDRIDRQILSLWLAGKRHSTIAQYVNIAPTGVRKRWERIKSELRSRLEAGEL